MTIQCLLFDIEGTTTDIAFVHQVLFPYSLERMERFIQDNRLHIGVQKCLKQVMDTVQEENTTSENGNILTEEDAVEVLKYWIQTDRKHPALKTLQGMIWEQGFTSGSFKGHVYPEVPECLSRWQSGGLKLAIYSSGSVQAQKLLFRYSEYGDLTPMLEAHFDTAVGGKKESESYRKIAQLLNLPPESILFISDVGDELLAAQAAGLQVVQSVRPNITPDDRFEQVENFNQLGDRLLQLSTPAV